MDKYISWKDMWSILEKVEYKGYDSYLGMKEMIELMKCGHGKYELYNGHLVFIRNFDLMDYKWSTSVIGSENIRYQTEKKEELIKRVYEEEKCIGWLLEHMRECFDEYDEEYFSVFYDRHFLNKKVEYIKNKYLLSNDKYYRIIETGEYLCQRAFLMLNPTPALEAIVSEAKDAIKIIFRENNL